MSSYILRSALSIVVLSTLVLALALFNADPAYAQFDESGFTNGQECTNGFCALAPAPGGSRLGNLYQSQDLGTFVNRLFTAALSLGAILAVLRLAFAGYMYMTKDSFQSKSNAKEIIGNVVLGLLLLLSIWIILKQINPQLLKLDFLNNIKPLPATPQNK